jgi:hypothetical protein
MKICIIALFFITLAGCGSEKPKIAIPPDSDLKTEMMFQGSGASRTIEVSFYFSKPVAPGVKTEPMIEVIPVEDARFNDTPLTEGTNAAGRITYTAPDLVVKSENVITAKLNGKPYEGRVIPLTTIPTRSATAVMTPK